MRRLGLLVLALAVVLTGCATTTKRNTAVVDVTGRWVGTWIGYGIADSPRLERAIFDLTQHGARGTGRVSLDNSGAAEAVPVSLRHAGVVGIRVNFAVAGSDVAITHELGPRMFAADLTVTGDRMVGRVSHADPPVQIVLTRVKEEAREPQTAAVTPQPPPVPVTPPPPLASPAPEPPAAEPPKASEVAAASPAPEVPARPEPKQFASAAGIKTIYFDFDKANIRPGEASVLEANAQWLKENADLQIIIEGHADERGTNEYNLALGEHRAKAAYNYLVSRGVQTERITTVSYGEERPTCGEKLETCFTRNRRAEFLVKPR